MKRYIALIILIIFSIQFCACQTNDKINEGNKIENEKVEVNKDECTEEESVNIYKQDYIQACTLICENYIYLDRKLNKSRVDFLEECMEYAETVDWSKGKIQFIEEIRKLRSKFNDGHFYWKLDKELWLNERGKFLGIIFTIGNYNKVYVGKVYPYFTDKLSVGDEIIKWNGEDIKTELERVGKLNPQSTVYATNELAARRLTFENPWQPLRNELEPVTITYKDKNGIISDINVEWKDCGGTLQWQNLCNENGHRNILLTRSYKPSLEDIPSDAECVHPSLLFYSRIVNSKKYTILHLRDFHNWNTDDLEKTFEFILNEEPDVLVIDLKDSPGGSFINVFYLANMLNINDNFKWYYEKIENGISAVKIGNINDYIENINFKNIWHGNVIFRINPLTQSAGDYFSRWMQLSERGMIIGQPSAGAGGEYQTYTLSNTNTTIEFPYKDSIIVGDDKYIEENSVIPDYFYNGELIDFLMKYDTLNIKTKANNE